MVPNVRIFVAKCREELSTWHQLLVFLAMLAKLIIVQPSLVLLASQKPLPGNMQAEMSSYDLYLSNINSHVTLG